MAFISRNLPCSHCMCLVIDGVTVEGQVKMYRFQDIDYEFERDTIIRLYQVKGVLEKMFFLENRVLQSFGILV